MIIHSIIISFVIIFFSFLLGRLLKKWFLVQQDLLFGFFSLLGIFEFMIYPMVLFKLPSKLGVLLLFFLLFLILIMAIVYRIDIKLSKEEGTIITLSLLVAILLSYVASNRTFGERYFDSVYYLSMVIENSVNPYLGRVHYYSGQASSIPLSFYDFQGFYHFYSMILKGYRQFFTETFSLTPLYIWTASMVYYFYLSYHITSLAIKFSKKKWYIGLLIIVFIFANYTNYFNVELAFYGNTLKTLAVSMLLLNYYQIIVDDKGYFNVFMLNSALIACSSTGAFLSLFLACSFFIYLTCKEKQLNKLVLSMIPIVVFFFQYFWITFHPIIALVFIVVYLVGLYLCDKLLKNLKYVFYLLLFVFIVGSYFVQNEKYNYIFFFKDHSTYDMTLDRFRFVGINDYLRNIPFWVLMMTMFIRQRKDSFIQFLFIILLFFINPIVCPFIVRFFTNEVYNRTFELITNPFVLSIAAAALYHHKTKVLYPLLIIMCIGLIGYNVKTPYNKIFIAPEGFNTEYRIMDDEVQLYEKVYEQLKGKDDCIIISQSSAIKGYLANIIVEPPISEIREGESYKHPNDRHVYFYPYAFYNESVYEKNPDFNSMEIIKTLVDLNPELIILSEKVSYYDNGGFFAPISYRLRNDTDKIYTSDNWSLLAMKKY